MIEIVVIVLAAIGWAFSLSGAVGILRMPDVYSRIPVLQQDDHDGSAACA